MSLPIYRTPYVTGFAASELLKVIEENELQKDTVDFTEEIERMRKIIQKELNIHRPRL